MALWAIDGPAPGLARWTVGEGPGARSDLLNSLLARASLTDDCYVIVSDDDVRLTKGCLSDLLRIVRHVGLDLAQPAHSLASSANHAVTRWEPLSLYRLTALVEIGPLFVVAPRFRSRILPFPEDSGMGWGVDLIWSSLRREGCRLGVVDAIPMTHMDFSHALASQKYAYDRTGEVDRLNRIMGELGYQSMDDLQLTVARTRAWGRPEQHRR